MNPAAATQRHPPRSIWRGRKPLPVIDAAFSNTVMCGQMAYDWNTIPNPRRFGATNTFFADE